MNIPGTKSEAYWLGLSYLMKKHKPDNLADALHLVSVVENYIAHHTESDLRQQLMEK